MFVLKLNAGIESWELNSMLLLIIRLDFWECDYSNWMKVWFLFHKNGTGFLYDFFVCAYSNTIQWVSDLKLTDYLTSRVLCKEQRKRVQMSRESNERERDNFHFDILYSPFLLAIWKQLETYKWTGKDWKTSFSRKFPPEPEFYASMSMKNCTIVLWMCSIESAQERNFQEFQCIEN